MEKLGTLYICDRCKKEMFEERFSNNVPIKRIEEYSVVSFLCNECFVEYNKIRVKHEKELKEFLGE